MSNAPTSPLAKATGLKYAKTALIQTLKKRLKLLTEHLVDAEVGSKGIDLIKEIKELQSLLDAQHAATQQQKYEPTKIMLVWDTNDNEVGSEQTSKNIHS